MKLYCEVESLKNIPPKFRRNVFVVTQSNWREAYEFLEGKQTLQYIFVHQNVNTDYLLKMVEDFSSDLVCYCAAPVRPVFLSRFTKTVSRKVHHLKPFPPRDEWENKLDFIKKAL